MEDGEYVYISRDISSLGSTGILMHSFHLFETHFKLFLSILLLIIAPTMIPLDDILFFKQRYASAVSVNNSTAAAAGFSMTNSTAAAEISMTNSTTAAELAMTNSIAAAEKSIAAAEIAMTNLTTAVEHAMTNSTAAAAIAMKYPTAAAEFKPPGVAENASIDFNFGHLLALVGIDQSNATAQRGARWKSQFQAEPSATAKALAVFIGGILLSVALSTIRRSFVTYSVGRVQVGKRATIVDAWHAFRVLWKRVLWTGVCEKIVWLAAMALMYSPVLFFDEIGDTNNLLRQLLRVTIVLSLVIRLSSAFAFQLATIVAVLDEACGWKAFGRGWSLLKRRKRVAVGIAILSNIAFLLSTVILFLVGVLVYVVCWFTSSLQEGKLYMPIPQQTAQREVTFLVVFAYPLANSVPELLTETLYAVFCISCMAFHQESISKSAFFQKLTRIGGDHDA